MSALDETVADQILLRAAQSRPGKTAPQTAEPVDELMVPNPNHRNRLVVSRFDDSDDEDVDDEPAVWVTYTDKHPNKHTPHSVCDRAACRGSERQARTC